MISVNNRNNAHEDIDRIFRELLPVNGMKEREGQITLSHTMLDAMLDGSIALCDAGTGIGKTYSYLVAGVMFEKLRAESGEAFQPVLISTASIALQNAVQNEYIPLLSGILLEAGMIDKPIEAVVRKGKQHYVCDERLERRISRVNLKKKNEKNAESLLSLQSHLDTDSAEHLSNYDKRQVCVPLLCECHRTSCRYSQFIEDVRSDRYLFQICNHNLLIADAIQRNGKLSVILPDYAALIIDEAHKLPEAARQMFGRTLSCADILSLIEGLRTERFILAAQNLLEAAKPLVQQMNDEAKEAHGIGKEKYALLKGMEKTLLSIKRAIATEVTPPLRSELSRMIDTLSLFTDRHNGVIRYCDSDEKGRTMFCTTTADLTERMREVLWDNGKPILLTSGTLAVKDDFTRFKEEAGIVGNTRLKESVSLSPFDYKKNCLLYIPETVPKRNTEDMKAYYTSLAREIAALLEITHGHALVLFTAYSAMAAVKELLVEYLLPYPIFTMSRNAMHTVEQFKASKGGILLATGSAWEGFDFPGDTVSALIIPRLPFATPDAISNEKQKQYESLKDFIRAVAVPDMQIKLKQGFGRAIRLETDTCVVALLDERVTRGRRYRQAAKDALPDMRQTNNIDTVADFLHTVKPEGYFTEVE